MTIYLYDNVGNRIASELKFNGKSKGYTEWKQNADNELLSITGEHGATYEYDENGHVSKKIRVTPIMPGVDPVTPSNHQLH
ncbi:hypothetical protein QYB16_002088 [Listeria monocytogenes]|nr:hypothetical protein [Listeria monocytogenes]